MKSAEIGEKISYLRKKQNISQKEFAKNLGVTDKAVSKWENGMSAPSLEKMYKICRFFNISFESLMSDSNVENKEKMSSVMQSLKELYRIGRGPSSSHTMGPEKICEILKEKNPEADNFKVILYGSLAQTGKGHGTDAVIKKTLSPSLVEIEFDYLNKNIKHPNTLEFFAYKGDEIIDDRVAYSIGGGAVSIEGIELPEDDTVYRFSTFEEISIYCKEKKMRLCDYVYEEEGESVREFLKTIWQYMKESIYEGLEAEGTLPGGLNVQKKAKFLYSQRHIDETPETKQNRLVCSYAFAASEQNASGETIVTAPTCGACGVVPAVLYYYQKTKEYTDDEIIDALATASLVGNLIKTNASISGAECGCQAEIGTACSMAAAALGELFGMSIEQIEYAAEVALEHHLGLTCDPVLGLVQIPCIERNAVAAMRAINAVNLANFLTNTRKISLDLIIQTMYETGKDLSHKYRETAIGGLAKLYN